MSTPLVAAALTHSDDGVLARTAVRELDRGPVAALAEHRPVVRRATLRRSARRSARRGAGWPPRAVSASSSGRARTPGTWCARRPSSTATAGCRPCRWYTSLNASTVTFQLPCIASVQRNVHTRSPSANGASSRGSGSRNSSSGLPSGAGLTKTICSHAAMRTGRRP